MTDSALAPDNTAVRVALWRALHVEIDASPLVLDDTIGLRLAAPPSAWRQRGDMDPRRTARNRASIVARSRYVEDLVHRHSERGVDQFVMLGAGLDTFAQRLPSGGPHLDVFEIDEPITQSWKQRRLTEVGLAPPAWLHFVPVDFDADTGWPDALANAGFSRQRPAIVASTGVSMYLTKTVTAETMRHIARFGPETTMVMSFLIPLESVDVDEQPALRGAERGANAAGTPWISFFTPNEIIQLARDAGFDDVTHVSPTTLHDLYFAGRADNLRPSSAEHLVVATTRSAPTP